MTAAADTEAFLVAYRPGATKRPHLVQDVGHGDDQSNEERQLEGVVNGDMTPVAISVVPLGSFSISGLAMNEKMSFDVRRRTAINTIPR